MKVVYRKGWVKIQQMYENLEFDLDLKLLFMVTGAYNESGLYKLHLGAGKVAIETKFLLVVQELRS